MKTFKHELEVTRGETFTIDRVLQNRDGSPYIISKYLSNPYFCLTVSSSIYDQENRYLQNFWLEIDSDESGLPRFEYTVPVTLEDIKNTPGDTSPKYPNGFSSLSGLPSGYIDGVHITFDSSDDAVFYSVYDNAYKYWNSNSGKWIDYECRLIITFTNDVTREWVEKNYWYSINLIAGQNPDTDENENPVFRDDNIDAVYPILRPAKITVQSNLKGGN